MTEKSEEIIKIEAIEDLLRKLLIFELGKAGIPQSKIKEIVGGDIHRVNKIVKHIKKRKDI